MKRPLDPPSVVATVVLAAAAALLASSLVLPYWRFAAFTDSRRPPVQLDLYVGHIEGLSAAATLLPGVIALADVSDLARSLGVATATAICLLLVTATLVHNRWAAMLALPALAFPWIAVAEMHRWLRPVMAAAKGPDPTLLSTVLGPLPVGGAAVSAGPGSGFLLALAASLLVLVGLAAHRHAYRRAGTA